MVLSDSPPAVLPTAESQLFVYGNSSLAKPHLYLYETDDNDFARLRLANSTYETKYWDVATWGGVFNIYYNGDGQNILQLLPDDSTYLLYMRNNARLTNGGAWTNASDRATKTNFAAVDGRLVLKQVAAMPISTWNYKNEPESARRMGPTAQDFYAAFGLGSDDKTISTVDAEGVALAALQGLHQVASDQSALIAELQAQRHAQEERIASLRQQNAEMQARLAAIETAVARMAGEAPGPGR